MIYPQYGYTCPQCGFDDFNGETCALCAGLWESWEMQFSPLPLPEMRAQVAAWLSQLPLPAMMEVAASDTGLKLRLFAPPGLAQGAVQSWAAMTHQQTRWKPVQAQFFLSVKAFALHSPALLPELAFSADQTDPLLALGGQLLGKGNVCLRFWLIGKAARL